MKKVMMVLLVVALVLGFSYSVTAGEKAAPKGKVAVCHYPAHLLDGEHEDYVITGSGGYCCDTGGEIKVVSVNACYNAHVPGNSDCFDTPIDEWLKTCD